MSGRHEVHFVAQRVACAALTLLVWQHSTNLSAYSPEEAGESTLDSLDTPEVFSRQLMRHPAEELEGDLGQSQVG